MQERRTPTFVKDNGSRLGCLGNQGRCTEYERGENLTLGTPAVGQAVSLAS